MFLALDISSDDKIKIAQWREQHLALPFKAIPAENFHITLAFLGLINATEQANLTRLIDQQHHHIRNLIAPYLQQTNALALTLAQVGYFKAAKVLHIMPAVSPKWLRQLNSIVVESCHESAIAIDNRRYQPHLSLYRKAKYSFSESSDKILADHQAIKVQQAIDINSFSLYHSYSTDIGVTYKAINTWAIN